MQTNQIIVWILSLSAVVVQGTTAISEEGSASPEVARWLEPQDWRRDTDGPIVALGRPGEFDDTHIFAPCVALEDGRYRLWYCGSTGAVKDRVFDLGLADSRDGRTFTKSAKNPVYQFGDGEHSILTPTLLRNGDGRPVREDGRLRMWFSSTHFAGASGLHTLHETKSRDGVAWAAPSAAELKHVYAPTVIWDGKTEGRRDGETEGKRDGVYRMWYTDVASELWTFRYAQSRDGRAWEVHSEPVLKVDQKWESGRLFYPCVLKLDGVFVMWYGSYWAGEPNKTALGVAASLDGVHWHKSPHNPVLRPDPKRAWESHYTTSESVVRLDDGRLRIWYASRKAPPFVNKYFAINTAIWAEPK